MKFNDNNFKRLIIFSIVAIMGFAVIAFFPSVNADCPSGMVAYWKLDETIGPTVVDSLWNYNGTNFGGGATIGEPGQVFTSYDFDSIDYIDCGFITELDGVPEFTIVGWIKHDNKAGQDRVFDKILNGNDDISIAPYGNRIYFEVGNGTNSYNWCPNPTTDGVWYHLAAVFNGNLINPVDRAKIYVDANPQVMTMSLTIPTRTSMNPSFPLVPFTLSRNADPFQGNMDEVAIFDYALTPTEIQNLYDKGYDGHSNCYCFNTVYVDDDYDESTSGWHLDHFDNIQDGVDAACDPGTVYVYDGTYSGSRVYKDLKIFGSITGTSIVDSGVHYGGGAPLTTAFHLDAGSDGTEIRDFTINCDQSSNYYFGVFSRGINDVIIDSLVINDAVQGITSWGGNNWDITNNILTDTVAAGGGGIGIFLGATPPLYRSCSDNLVQYNTIYADGTEVGYTSPGICLCVDVRWSYGDLNGSEEVTNNQILDNDITGTGNVNEVGIETGVIGVSGDPVKIAYTMGMIHHNFIENNVVDGSDYGIYAYVVEDLVVECNEIINSVTHGVSIWDDFTGNINYNDIVGNGYGLYSDISTSMIDAECNWWGSDSGPSDFGPGTGDAVSDYVDFDPWIHVIADAGGPYSIEENSGVNFDSSASSVGSCGTITYDWDFGDGTPHVTVPNPVHNYANIGSYSVTLTITLETSCGNIYLDSDSTTVTSYGDPPLIQLNYPRGGEMLSGTITIDYYAIDDDHPGDTLPIYIYYSADDGDTWREVIDDLPLKNNGDYSWNTNNYADGEYKILVEAVDKRLNIAFESSDPFRIDNGNMGAMVSDVKISDITINSVQYVKDGDTLEISAGITGSIDLSKNDITADLSSFGWGNTVMAHSFDDFTATWLINNAICNPTNGQITVTVYVSDYDRKSDSIIADNIKPEMNILKPEKGLYLFNSRLLPIQKTIIIGPLTVMVDGIDANGISKAEFYLDGELKLTDTGVDPEWYMNIKQKGQHNLEIKVYDNAGNSVTESRLITVFKLLGN